MQSELFDKKIKEAAENHHPAYDEKAWNKMEKLLDEHMPQKKDRRRIIFFLLLFLLLGGGAAYLFIGQPWKTNHTIAASEKKTNQDIANPANEEKSSKDQSGSTTIVSENKNQQTTGKNEVTDRSSANTNQPQLPGKAEQQTGLVVNKSPVTKLIPKNNVQPKQTETANNPTVFPNNKNNTNIAITPSNNERPASVLNNDNSLITKNDNASTKPVTDNSSNKNEEKNVTPDKNIANNIAAEANKKDEVAKNEQSQKKNTGKNKQKDGFAFTASFGPDVSKARSSGLGKLDWSYGAGVSYTLKKFTLRSGFYVAQKVYSAAASDYKLEYTLPPNIKFLSSDANCKVYEIPLSLAYNFAQGKNSSWFASLGLSSYLMKSEKYKNWYKNTTSGSTYPYKVQYADKNKHYFSVLDISAGYTYRINNTFSLSAEPYLKLPLQGIGEGKVHLNSAGVLFSVGIKPFKAKNR